jgi:hypothetical protein
MRNTSFLVLANCYGRAGFSAPALFGAKRRHTFSGSISERPGGASRGPRESRRCHVAFCGIRAFGTARRARNRRAKHISSHGFRSNLRAVSTAGDRGLYPGVDAVLYGSGADLEYDLLLTRGAPADRIRISVKGSRNLTIDRAGNLIIGTASGVLRQIRLRVFQAGREVSASYVLLGANQIALRLGKHDRGAPLTIGSGLDGSFERRADDRPGECDERIHRGRGRCNCGQQYTLRGDVASPRNAARRRLAQRRQRGDYPSQPFTCTTYAVDVMTSFEWRDILHSYICL